jgi:hypothetical protein
LGASRSISVKLQEGRRRLVDQYRKVRYYQRDLRRGFMGGYPDVGDAGLNPENMIWIFGTGRSGSTWLSSMMGAMERHRVWDEPFIGRLFGEFYENAPRPNLRLDSFIMGDPVRRGWIRAIRNFALDSARYVYPDLGPDAYLIIKEPNGSVGAPLLMEALPESRMILLVRDPRDVVASSLDGAREGHWLHERRMESRSGRNRGMLPAGNENAFVRRRASSYVRAITYATRAYEAHKGRKALVRYEELRADTLGTMRRLYSILSIPAVEAQLARAVEKHSWENIPERKKGEGKVYRKASPGGWREDLTPSQVEIVERITAPLLEQFYPEDSSPTASSHENV